MKELPPPSREIVDEVIDHRRHLHQDPEIAFEEHRTSEYVRNRLAQIGLELRDCPTETGAVAILRTGRPGKTVMLRADIDALNIHEASGVGFESKTEGKMHGCGHDAHTAILLGAAHHLVERVDDLRGNFVFVFQPAEEVVQGAKAMIAAGLLDQNPADFILGLHTWSPLKSGTVVARPGVHWAGTDAFEINFTGPGGHGGVIKRRGNVVGAQAFLVERLWSIVEGLEHDGTPCHTSIGEVRCEGAFNVIGPNAMLRGTVRSFTKPLRDEAMQRLGDLLLETDTEFEVRSELTIHHSSVPLVNDADVTRLVLDEGKRLIGGDATVLGRPLTVGDDIAEFMLHIPGCYFMLGCLPPDAVGNPPAHHSPTFRLDEPAFEVGLKVLAGSAARLAADGPGTAAQ